MDGLPPEIEDLLHLGEMQAGPTRIVYCFQGAYIPVTSRPGQFVRLSLMEKNLPTVACKFRQHLDDDNYPHILDKGKDGEDPLCVYFGTVKGLFQHKCAGVTSEFAHIKCWKYSEIDEETGVWRVDIRQGHFEEEPFVPVDDCVETVGHGSVGDHWIYILGFFPSELS